MGRFAQLVLRVGAQLIASAVCSLLVLQHHLGLSKVAWQSLVLALESLMRRECRMLHLVAAREHHRILQCLALLVFKMQFRCRPAIQYHSHCCATWQSPTCECFTTSASATTARASHW